MYVSVSLFGFLCHILRFRNHLTATVSPTKTLTVRAGSISASGVHFGDGKAETRESNLTSYGCVFHGRASWSNMASGDCKDQGKYLRKERSAAQVTRCVRRSQSAVCTGYRAGQAF